MSLDNKCIVGIEKFGDSAIEVGMRYWVPTRSFFKIQYEVNLAVYKALHEAQLSIPYPQRDVHVYGQTVI
jgi:small conductance mechanosensitive channel